MENNLQIRLLKVVLTDKISQMVRKYGDQAVSKILHEIRLANGAEPFFRVCGWKTEMTLVEAFRCLDDYCDFVEAMIRKWQEREKGKVHYIPALFN